jgi:hypothetical protein
VLGASQAVTYQTEIGGSGTTGYQYGLYMTLLFQQ